MQHVQPVVITSTADGMLSYSSVPADERVKRLAEHENLKLIEKIVSGKISIRRNAPVGTLVAVISSEANIREAFNHNSYMTLSCYFRPGDRITVEGRQIRPSKESLNDSAAPRFFKDALIECPVVLKNTSPASAYERPYFTDISEVVFRNDRWAAVAKPIAECPIAGNEVYLLGMNAYSDESQLKERISKSFSVPLTTERVTARFPSVKDNRIYVSIPDSDGTYALYVLNNGNQARLGHGIDERRQAGYLKSRQSMEQALVVVAPPKHLRLIGQSLSYLDLKPVRIN